MIFSKTMIFNLTLNALGVSSAIENSNMQSDTRAILLNNQYEFARDNVLKDFDWNFAMAFKDLALTGNKCPDPKYLYEFAYPNDCVSARAVLDELGKEKQFRPATNESGQKVILTKINPCKLRYTRLVTKEALFCPEFAFALVQMLAFLTSEVITGSSEKGNNALKKYQMIIGKAKAQNANEGADEDENDTTYIDDRF